MGKKELVNDGRESSRYTRQGAEKNESSHPTKML